tara:strand:- start:863 stop:1801 length:939 start_codon:yes stop_codon:yes gene_type:complete
MNIDSLVRVNDSLNTKLWNGDSLKEAVRSKLIEIANEFYDGLDIVKKALVDITFTGSLANYNYNNASDIDLHLIVDFEKVDNNKFLVGEYFKAMARDWNRMHEIKIKGYEVEIYVQDKDEPHHSTGIYSLLSSSWIHTPTKKEFNPDESTIDKKIDSFVEMIDKAEELYDDHEYEEAHELTKKTMSKIKKYRQSGLENSGELSNENIVFKYLRNNNIIKTLVDLRNMSYDKLMSINGSPEKMFKVFISKPEKAKSFNRLTELERYQRKIRRGHSKMKKRLIGTGKVTKGGRPYYKKPSMRRAKSAPPGAGGS